MAVYMKDKIRNIAIVGHSGEGKTSLLEAILFATKAIDRLGSVPAGNTVSDFDQEEINRKMSISLSLASTYYKDYKFNFLDVPGFFDFEGEMMAALSVADTAIIVTSATGTLSVGTEKAIETCTEKGVPMFVWVNGINKENSSYSATVEAIRAKYGVKIVPIEIPVMNGYDCTGYVDVVGKKAYDLNGKEIAIPGNLSASVEEYNGVITEAAAEADDELLEKFFSGEELTQDELFSGMKKRMNAAEIIPIVGGAAVGKPVLTNLLNNIVNLFASPAEGRKVQAVDSKGETIEIECDENGKFAAQVFKTIVDKFIGKLNLFKVASGKVKLGDQLLNTANSETEKVSALLAVKGGKTEAIDSLYAGDIGAFAKMSYTSTGNTLCDPANEVTIKPIDFPEPVISFAVSSPKQEDEEKVISSLYRLMDEDTTFKVEKNVETTEILLSGVGEMQIDILCKKVKNKFGYDVTLNEPKISFRETIKKTVEAEGKHKKQSGGAGQFGQCSIRFEPGAADGEFEFVDAIVGGAIPRQYIPAVEKGLREAIKKGVLAGYPMVNLKCTVFDGKYHPVDSKEIAFITAAKLAYADGCAKAGPALLEPIYSIKVTIPESYMGDIMGDLNKRRGKIFGMETVNGKTVVNGEVPLAEMFRYATDLRSMTQGRGKFSMKFERYEEAAPTLTQKVVEEYKKSLNK